MNFTLGDAFQHEQLFEITDYRSENGEFQLGVIAMTRLIRDAKIDREIIHHLLHCHHSGNFGNLGEVSSISLTQEELEEGVLATDDSGKLNKLAILGQYPTVMSEYDVDGQTIWVRTEDVNGSETYTTIMFPSEY